MANSKPFLKFKNRLDNFLSDLEFVDMIHCKLKKDYEREWESLLSCKNENHKILPKNKPTARTAEITIFHLKQTLRCAVLKDVYEETTMYLKEILNEIASLAKIAPERISGNSKGKIAIKEILSLKTKEDIYDYVVDAIVQELEQERSTKKMIENLLGRMDLDIDKSILDKAVNQLDIRHKFVHCDGYADKDFREKHPWLKYNKEGMIELHHDTLNDIINDVLVFVREIDKKGISKQLLEPHVKKK